MHPIKTTLALFLLIAVAGNETAYPQQFTVTVSDRISGQAVSGALVEYWEAGQLVNSSTTDVSGIASLSTVTGIESEYPGGEASFGAPYPNPTAGHVTITGRQSEASLTSLELIDMLGRTVSFISGRASGLVLEGSGEGFSAGLYFLRLSTHDQNWTAPIFLGKRLRRLQVTLAFARQGSESKPDIARKNDSSEVRVTREGYLAGTVPYQGEAQLQVPVSAGTLTAQGAPLLRVPAGDFMRGATIFSAPFISKPAHEVVLTHDYFLGKYEYTQAEFVQIMGSNPSAFSGDDQLPVGNARLAVVARLLNNLSDAENLANCYTVVGLVAPDWPTIYDCTGYRLPTEAEWERACKAGTNTEYEFGDDTARVPEFAWISQNAGGKTHPVGTKKPNSWGFHDLHGNAWELTEDFEHTYTAGSVTNPTSPFTNRHVIRGGSVTFSAQAASCTSREMQGHVGVHDDLSFRVARTAN